MTDESYSFSTARNRLEEIVSQVRKKDTSLEKSLDLLEEGVKLANACTELIDHQDWGTAVPVPAEGVEQGAPDSAAEAVADGAEPSDPAAAVVDAAVSGETIIVDEVAVIEDVVITDEDGTFVAEVIEVTAFDAASEFEDADGAWADEGSSDEPEDAGDPSSSDE